MGRSWVLTGAGVICGAGDSPEAIYGRLLDGVPLATATGADDPGFPAVPIRNFDPKNYFKRRGAKNFSRTSQLACAASARLKEGLGDLDASAVGVVLGSAWASLETVVRFERAAHVDGPRLVDPILFTETVANVPAGQVSICLGWSALNATVSGGTSSGLEALRLAIDFLEEDRADVIVAGGGDELNGYVLRTLAADGLTASGPDALPLRHTARGPIASEGACMLALESRNAAEARGAGILATLRVGVGAQIEERDDHGVAPRAARLEALLGSAGVAAAEVDMVVLSANGTAARDRMEAATLRRVFGTPTPPALAPKAILGETWAASGPIGVVAAVESMRSARIPARPAAMRPDAGYDGLFLPETALDRRVRHALVLDCSEAGQFSAVLVSAEGS